MTETRAPAASPELATEEGGVEIRLNGEPHRLAGGGTVADLVAELGKDPRTLAIEHNGSILSRARWGEITLATGDRLEVVHFVQGG